MLKAEQIAVAMVVIGDDEWFFAGSRSDIQRLGDAGYVERAWDVKLDNGHRPYAVLKKRLNFDIDEAAGAEIPNKVTAAIVRETGLTFAHNLHHVEDTYLFREEPSFWTDLEVAFGEDGSLPQGKRPDDYYAIYRGYILHTISSVKFIRL